MAAPQCHWLPGLVATQFFSPCGRCSASSSACARETVLNYFCTGSGETHCAVCLADAGNGNVLQVRAPCTPTLAPPCRPGASRGLHRVISLGFCRCSGCSRPDLIADCSNPTPPHAQVRRSSYHDVVKVADVARVADVGGVQPYVINGSKVLFLRRRPQPRPPKGAAGASQCAACARHLQDVSRFCSLECKLDGGAAAGGEGAAVAKFAPAPAAAAAPARKRLLALPAADSGSAGASAASRPEAPPRAGARGAPSALAPLRDASGSESDSGGEESRLGKRRKAAPARSPLE
jgi:hypothetical protein